jgi:hypothetical protein
MSTNSKKYDKYLNGFAIGVIAPIIVLIVVCLVRFNGRLAFTEFINKMHTVNALSPLLSLCALINLGIFFLFYQYWYNNAARGVIMATFLIAFVVLAFKINLF